MCAASLAVALSACGSKTESASPPAVASTISKATTSVCPTAAPATGVAPEWTLAGATGSVAVTGSTDAAAPLVKVDTPFSVTQTQVHTLTAGDGPVVPDTATVSVCYDGVDGRNGSVFDSSYEQGEPVQFALNRVVPGFQKSHRGAEGRVHGRCGHGVRRRLPDGQPSAGIEPGDSLISRSRFSPPQAEARRSMYSR